MFINLTVCAHTVKHFVTWFSNRLTIRIMSSQLNVSSFLSLPYPIMPPETSSTEFRLIWPTSHAFPHSLTRNATWDRHQAKTIHTNHPINLARSKERKRISSKITLMPIIEIKSRATLTKHNTRHKGAPQIMPNTPNTGFWLKKLTT